MAFVVEDGTGLTNSNSYASVADWTTYFTDRNNTTALAYTIAEIQGALVYATAYLEQNVRWCSWIASTTQALSWPRVTFFDSQGRIIEGMPQRLIDATCELGLAHLTDGLNSSDSENVVSERYGDASITYKGGSKSHSFIKLMLREYGVMGFANENAIFRS